MQVPFGEWLPDQPEHLKPGANVATNVYHTLNTYKRFPSLVNYTTNNVGSNARGAGSFRDNSNNIFNFVATNSNIYQLATGTFTSRKSSLTGADVSNAVIAPMVTCQPQCDSAVHLILNTHPHNQAIRHLYRRPDFEFKLSHAF